MVTGTNLKIAKTPVLLCFCLDFETDRQIDKESEDGGRGRGRWERERERARAKKIVVPCIYPVGDPRGST